MNKKVLAALLGIIVLIIFINVFKDVLGIILLILLGLLVTAIILVIKYLIAKEFYKIAVEKGYTAKKYLWLSFSLDIIGYLLVIALPDHIDRQELTNDELPDL